MRLNLRRRGLLQSAGATLGSAVAGSLFPLAGHVLATASRRFEIGSEDFLLDGQRLQIRCGEVHFARVPREYWAHRLKSIKAMGLNAVCAYLFWNYHEWREGRFDWAGQRDAAEFCRLAQAEGLYVILRPGPYACAEWEMGGLPWWLLKHPGDAFLRTRDAAYIGAARRWLREVGRVLGAQQITRGGPILMVQVENEYGFYGDDVEYLRVLRQALLDAGFDVPLFQCNPTDAVSHTHIPELFSVANFGSDPEGGFKALAAVQTGPRMCGEYYSGWFDTWGGPHRRGGAEAAAADIGAMLKANGSFSLYMAHGGTSFGLWAGCDRPFRPDTTSYDYDAPISEAGWVGEKFAAYRAAIVPFLAPGATLPEPPARNPLMTIPAFALREWAPVSAALSRRVIHDVTPRPIEQYDISRGLVSYRVTVPAGPAGTLEASCSRDLAWVSLDGKPLGTLDTRLRRYSIEVPARPRAARLEILLYTIARVNFGVEVHDRKGLQGPVTFTSRGGPAQPLEHWQIRALDLDADAALPKLAFSQTAGRPMGAGFWRGGFDVQQPADTFIDMSGWGQGIVWINGRCLGRFWSIGPTQTMYLPGPWVNPGRNEVVVLDLTGPRDPRLAGLAEPILDQLHRERDLVRPPRRGRPRLEGVEPAHQGEFAPGSHTQTVWFSTPLVGRQFCLESLSAFDGKPYAAVAEIALLGRDGQPLKQSDWSIAFVDSEEMTLDDGAALNAINGQASDHWHTALDPSKGGKGHPHQLIIDLGASVEVAGLRYLPRQGTDAVTGRIRRYRAYVADVLVSDDP